MEITILLDNVKDVVKRQLSIIGKHHSTQKGDTLFSIARKFNVEHSDLMKWNHDKQLARLMPGFKLTLRTH